MKYSDYLKQIIKFNSDKELVSLREMYNRPSFFEIISKARSETTYSAFLKWLLLENSTDNNIANPIYLLLNILIQRSDEQQLSKETILVEEDIKSIIATKHFNILSTKVEIEKNVSSLAQVVLDENKELEQKRREQLERIAANSKDRIDILVECELNHDGKENKLQIIIENKIDSKEGGVKKSKKIGDDEYDKATQTTRYYLGTNSNKKETLQIYVYLTPLSARELDDFANLASEKKCNDKHFVQINYQDVVDGIALPMLASSSLSSRSRFFVEEFVNELTFPSLEGDAVHSSIALSSEYEGMLTKIWEKHKQLIIDSSIAASERDFWILNNDTFYDHQPKEEILDLIIGQYHTELYELVKNQIVIQPGTSYQWKQNTKFDTILKNIGSRITVMKVSQVTDSKVVELLTRFWEKNKRFLTALMEGIIEEERKKVECLLLEVTKRDTTKYNVFFDNQKINDHPLGKGETAHAIVYKWAKCTGDFSLDDIRNAFPVKWNSYYANGKLFKYLIYKKDPNSEYSYDGTNKLKGESVPSKSNFDFDKGEKFDIENNSKEKFILLKMWRKDGLEKFIKYAKGLTVFKGKLEVQEA